ncbi:hypothetical protein HPB52_010619 [Rhipicephalus sanguineus]|uniref:Uncharacterized protein n=1 Tax=Rhipicephalus sanguineus TaxID=34632 RepID=A0A9D4T9D6_RHISA|nr:hypothetical protein HPB52_010619 [Rhipicephalus sanguineus]
MVRRLGGLVGEEDRRVGSDPRQSKPPYKKIVSCLRTGGLTVLQSGKEGGFAVMPLTMFKEKATKAHRTLGGGIWCSFISARAAKEDIGIRPTLPHLRAHLSRIVQAAAI